MKSWCCKNLSYVFLLVGLLALFVPTHAQAPVPANNASSAMILSLDGAIGPAVASYIQHGIEKANQDGFSAIIIEMDTPGGLDQAMRDIIKSILDSDVPVITYVTPSGSRAASAGTYILYASHVAAMAPGTNLGAATPVSIMPSMAKGVDKESDKSQSATSAKEKKVINDATAYIRSLAQLRHRNEAWAIKAVTEGESLSAVEALKRNVIDIMADNLQTLLTKVDSRKVTLKDKTVVMHTKDMHLVTYKPDWRIKFLMVITNPSVAYILLMIGFYGLFFEFSNPGTIIPGVAGGIALLLALYAFQMLPVSYVGLGLIVLGLGFMTAEAFMPSVGALGIGGVIAFIVGSILLFEERSLGFQISYSIIAAMTIVSVLFFLIIFQLALRSHRRKIVSGQPSLLGKKGIVVYDKNQLWVEVQGELWSVTETELDLQSGENVEIITAQKSSVTVKRVNNKL